MRNRPRSTSMSDEYLYINIQDKFKVLCKVVTDFSKIPPTSTEVSEDGVKCNIYKHDVLFFFGGSELKAQLAWKDNVSVDRSNYQ